MGLVLKHVQRTKAGTLHYRRRIPQVLRGAVGRREFKRLLGTTERQALLAYPKVNAEFAHLLSVARIRIAGMKAPQQAHKTALDAFAEARERYAAIALTLPDDDPEADSVARDAIAESVLAKYQVDRDTGEPLGVPEVDRLYVNAVRSGVVERPPPTLEDAKRLYIREKLKGTGTTRIERTMRHLTTVFGKDRRLSTLERWEARDIRDNMLAHGGIKPATVRRYMNDIRAMITHGILEFGLRGVVNPFDGLQVPIPTAARDERKPMSVSQIKQVRSRLARSANVDLQRVWRLLVGTGCRLGEVTGLLVTDVFLDHEDPYLDLVFHSHRRLKNRGSIRRVPLIGDALEAVNEAIEAAEGGPLLFKRYGRQRGADGASAALMKHVRMITADPKVVVHSLRHSVEDRLIRADVSEFDRNLILGHTQGGMGERYGGPDARLRAATRALERAFVG